MCDFREGFAMKDGFCVSVASILVAAMVATLPLSIAAQSNAPAAVAAVAPGGGEGCDSILTALASPPQGGGAQGANAAAPAFDVSNLDKTVSPCSNFHDFAAGGWIEKNPIPPAYTRWGTFNLLQDHNEEVMHQILEDASKNPKSSTDANWQKIGDFYTSCMNEAAIETAGTKPLQVDFAQIAAVKDLASLETEIARLDRKGVNAVLGYGSTVDEKNSSMNIAGADQAGLSLPDRDYYLRSDDRSKKLRAGYVDHVTNMFVLLGDDKARAAAQAATVLSIETELAKSSMDRVERRDPDKTYHILTLDDLKTLTPHFSWTSYMTEVGSPSVTSVDVASLDFFKALDGTLQSVPLSDWKTYLRWHVVHSYAAALPKAFVDENFGFFGKTLTGAQEQQPRWRRCVRATDRQLGEALGPFYVQRAFPPEAKARAMTMVHNLIAELREDLQTLDWMSPDTRKQALVKLDALNLKIGYPEKWRDYADFKVTRDVYVTNVQRGDLFNVAFDMRKINKPVDRAEWDMTPPTVNAYYSPNYNEIVFPAGILQPPFFNDKADDAINYGGIGTVIGHEMTHGFDDQGAKYDAKGNLKNWWTPEDLKNFQERGDCIAKQFSGYQIETGLNVNGKLVEGESIADLGGLTISYRAFQATLKGKPTPPPIDGFTADQRFFLGYGQIWASSIRIEQARVFASVDPHPPDNFRVNGPLSNMPAFSQAFHCSADSTMVRSPEARCRIW
jgi:putative endopeptidase